MNVSLRRNVTICKKKRNNNVPSFKFQSKDSSVSEGRATLQSYNVGESIDLW